MSVGAGWYARNISRSYPLAATATCISDSGSELPESVIADMSIRFNGAPTDRAYLSHVAVGDTLAVVIALGGRDIAAVSISREDAAAWQPVPVKPIEHGVEGYIVFGSLSGAGEWSFASALQTGLSLRAANPQVSINNPARFSRLGVVDLVGPTLRLRGSGDILIGTGDRTLDGVEREAIIISLTNAEETQAAFAGECGKRPETGTCDNPQPFERINAVQPDCCGRIFIEIRGCATLDQIVNECGVAITCGLTTDEGCPPNINLPSDSGVLPFQEDEDEEEDECEDINEDPSSGQQF